MSTLHELSRIWDGYLECVGFTRNYIVLISHYLYLYNVLCMEQVPCCMIDGLCFSMSCAVCFKI